MELSNRSGDHPPAAAPEKTSVAGGLMPLLATAREKLKLKDLPAALAIYESILASASDRSDVLMTISADLGTNGYVQEIIEVLAPRYDVEKHGAPAGINLLQAYLVTRNAEAAQHLLDLLFSLGRPELEARLVGFSNAVAELFISETEAVHTAEPGKKISLVSISKPIWFYGLEPLTPHLWTRPSGKPRRVAFAQCALLGLENPLALAGQSENETGQLCRGLPLWLAETFSYSAGYAPVAAIGTFGDQYAVFPMEWTAENLRQFNDSTEGGLDYVVTGTLRNRNDDFELIVRIWEVKKFRELKSFSAQWTPASGDSALLQLREQLCKYMEWTALPAQAGLTYSVSPAPLSYILSLGASLSFFLSDKGVLASNQQPENLSALLRAAQVNYPNPPAQFALIASLLRHPDLGIKGEPEAYQHAKKWLNSAEAAACQVEALQAKLA